MRFFIERWRHRRKQRGSSAASAIGRIRPLAAGLLFTSLVFAQTNPFAGRWDFNIGAAASWLGVTEKPGGLEIWFQPTTGNVYKVTDYKLEGSHLLLHLPRTSVKHPAMTWSLDARGGKLTGIQDIESTKTALTGERAPELKRAAPAAWSTPEPLFNGKDLSGWEPLGDVANSHWTVEGGLLVNREHGANLKTTRKFSDFKLHFEANCPDGANSGFYLRGRYEVQLDYEAAGAEPAERRMGSIYGRIAPHPELPGTPGRWETFDVTLVGRFVTVVHNGVTTIDHQEIEGITGGALDASESLSGPFYIQGDHTGGLKFRNITVAVPRPQ